MKPIEAFFPSDFAAGISLQQPSQQPACHAALSFSSWAVEDSGITHMDNPSESESTKNATQRWSR